MNFFNRMGTRDISLLGIALYYVMLERMGKFTIRQMNRDSTAKMLIAGHRQRTLLVKSDKEM